MNYYRRYIGDYQRDTAHLTLCEHGAYAVLLDAQYGTSQPLPSDYPSLYRLCRAMEPHEQAAVRSVADQFFPMTDGGKRSNPRAEKELAKAAAAIDEMRAGGVFGAAKRWGKDGVGHGVPYGVGHADPNGEANGVEHGVKHGVAIDPPTTNHQPPRANPQEPTASRQEHPRSKPLPAGAADAASRPARKRRVNGEATSAAVWTAYATGYRQRYGVDPTRNAKVNGQLAHLIARLGAEEAPGVAGWYPGHNAALYVRSGHCVDLLLRDCEKLRTEWATGRQVTHGDARLTDNTQTTANVWGPIIDEAREAERLKLLALEGGNGH